MDILYGSYERAGLNETFNPGLVTLRNTAVTFVCLSYIVLLEKGGAGGYGGRLLRHLGGMKQVEKVPVGNVNP